MKPICYMLVSLYWAIASASAEPEPVKEQGTAPAQIHLYLDGQWTMDSDIFIFPDDTYIHHTYSNKDRHTVSRLQGKSEGLFQEVIGLVDKFDMWKTTAASLKEDLKKAQGSGRMGVADATHYYLTISTKDRTLKADFYAPDSFSSRYPQAKQLAAFNHVTKLLIQKTEKREQAGTGQPATRPQSKSEGSQKPQPETEGRSR